MKVRWWDIMGRINAKMLYIESYATHYHEKDLEILLVLEGELKVRKVEREVCVKAGEFTLINRFIVHSMTSTGAKVISFKICLENFSHIFNKIEYVEFLNNDELLDIERPLKDRMNAILVDYLIRLYQMQQKKESDKERIFSEDSLVHLLFTSYQLSAHMKVEEEYPPLEMQLRYYSIVEYIIENINKKMVIEDILDEFYMNPAYFSQFMKKIGGIGFKSFLSYRRLVRITIYLLEDQLSITDIANAVGIQNMKSFYSLFKKYFDESPVKWKERIAKIDNQYHYIEDKESLYHFIKVYHVDKHRENTATKLYKYLVVAKANKIDLNGTEIHLNPYLDMGKEIDPYYQVYRSFDMLSALVKEMKAEFVIVYPFIYLKDMVQRDLFFAAFRIHIMQFGLFHLRKWRVVLQVEKTVDIQSAHYIKERAEKELGMTNIKVSLDLLGG